jgi:hypothetical protein
VVSWELPIQDVEDAESAGVGVGKILSRRVSGSEARRVEDERKNKAARRRRAGRWWWWWWPGGGSLPVVG